MNVMLRVTTACPMNRLLCISMTFVVGASNAKSPHVGSREEEHRRHEAKWDSPVAFWDSNLKLLCTDASVMMLNNVNLSDRW